MSMYFLIDRVLTYIDMLLKGIALHMGHLNAYEQMHHLVY